MDPLHQVEGDEDVGGVGSEGGGSDGSSDVEELVNELAYWIDMVS